MMSRGQRAAYRGYVHVAHGSQGTDGCHEHPTALQAVRGVGVQAEEDCGHGVRRDGKKLRQSVRYAPACQHKVGFSSRLALTVPKRLDDGGQEGGNGRECAVRAEVDDASGVYLSEARV